MENSPQTNREGTRIAYLRMDVAEKGGDGAGDLLIPRPKNKLYLYSLVASLILIGTFERVLLMVMLHKMEHYTFFLSEFVSLIFIPVMFGAVWWKLSKANSAITPEMLSFSKKKFAVMGFLDMLAGLLVMIPGSHVDGSVATLIFQGGVPLTMFLSIIFLRKKYTWMHKFGSFGIALGIFINMWPYLTAPEDSSTAKTIMNIVALLCSNIPTAFSTIYKEVAMKQEMDEYLLNGWVALFQFLFGLPLAPLAFWLQSDSSPSLLPQNIIDAFSCLGGTDPESLDNTCNHVGWIVLLYIIFNIIFNIVIILILKEGSATLLVNALTVTVPFSYLAFSLPFVMDAALTWYSIPGLVLTVGGLVAYNHAVDPEANSLDSPKEVMGDDPHSIN
eukprot:gnl/Hemi2/18808_TR6224_c0_g1_i1.p1 gnl/Hemi2/18808_TR6224_c0_g1~~gnl/Hemi2/18808_TR6224_c0_g1_i1.p1  ORF type:complete len:411 (+),score=103.46 gnl/Hemi2/18808_TR6224_c0_g1_i1:71-1234(+)